SPPPPACQSRMSSAASSPSRLARDAPRPSLPAPKLAVCSALLLSTPNHRIPRFARRHSHPTRTSSRVRCSCKPARCRRWLQRTKPHSSACDCSSQQPASDAPFRTARLRSPADFSRYAILRLPLGPYTSSTPWLSKPALVALPPLASH